MKVAILGYGNIGSGVATVLFENRELIRKRTGVDVELKYVLDLREFEEDPIREKLVHDIDTIVNDPEVDIVCETMGGVEPAYSFSKAAILKGKSVCTSNKELVAAKGPELLRLSKENSCNYFFEASVGGGIPIIRTICESLRGEEITSIKGILNGTTNYILTKMELEGADFDTVLRKAQELGYAEKNPAADVEGHDACRKIAILSSLMTGKTVHFEDIRTEGITKVTGLDFAYAKALGRSIKLLAMSKRTEDGVFAMVAPFMIPAAHPLHGVNDVFNAVYVHGTMLDDSMYYGRGAGKLPTASAVVGDVVQAVLAKGRHIDIDWSEESLTLLSDAKIRHRFFVRFNCKEDAGLVKKCGADRAIMIPEDQDGFAVVTKELSEQEFAALSKELTAMVSAIRLED